MSIVRNFGETLRYELETLRRVPLRKKGLVLGKPQAPSVFSVTTSRNTAITAEFEERSFLVTYDRIPLQTHLGNSLQAPGHGMTLKAKAIKTTRDLLDDVNRTYDLALVKEDIIDEPMSIDFTAINVGIKMAPDCLWFTGSAVLPLKGKYAQVGNELVVGFDASLLIGIDKGTGPSAVHARAGQFTHQVDYGPQSVALKAITWNNAPTWSNTPVAQVQSLANALNNVDGFGWTYNASAGVKNNLNGGNVVYNGPVEGFDLKGAPTVVDAGLYYYNERFPLCRQDKTHVLVYQPNPNYGASNLGYYPMFIHYGENVPSEHLTQADKPPVHWWKLEEDLLNSGTSTEREQFPDIVSFFDDELGKSSALKAVGLFPLGFSWDTNRDFTLGFELTRRDMLQEYQGLFGDSTGTAPIGACVMFANGRWYLAQQTDTWNNTLLSGTVFRQRCQVMVCKRGKRVLFYVNGKCVLEGTFTDAQALAPWTHFGKVNHFLKTTTRFGNIKLFDYCLNRKQVVRHYRGLL